MKTTLKICNMRTLEDISKVRMAISKNEGVVACQLNREKGEAQIVYDAYMLDIEVVIEKIEELGFSVI